MRAVIRVPRPLLRPAVPTLRPQFTLPCRPTVAFARTLLSVPRLGAMALPQLRSFATKPVQPVEAVLTPTPVEEATPRRKRTYKRMKPNGDAELEIAATIKALRQKARLSPKWISHVLQLCGTRAPDVRARSKQAMEIFDSWLSLAQGEFAEVPSIAYSALIGALVNNLARRPTEAPELLKNVQQYVEKMNAGKHELALPTLTSLVRLYGLAKQPEKAMAIVQSVEEKGMETDIQWHNTLIEMYYLNAAADKAKLVQEKLLKSQDLRPNTITYNLMMKIAVQRNDYRDVLEHFKVMKENGVTADQFSYLEAIRAAGRLSEPATAQTYFDEMLAAGHKPAIYVWTALVDAYCRSNAIKKAFELTDDMRHAGVPPDTVIWRIIRDAAQRCGKGDMWQKLRPSWVSNLNAASDRSKGRGRDRRRRQDDGEKEAKGEGGDERDERGAGRGASARGYAGAPGRNQGRGEMRERSSERRKDDDKSDRGDRDLRSGDQGRPRRAAFPRRSGLRSPPRRDEQRTRARRGRE